MKVIKHDVFDKWKHLLLLLAPAFLLSSCSYTFYSSSCSYPRPGRLASPVVMDSLVHESSGLVWFEGSVWTFNDSGGEPELYEVDPASGKVLSRTRLEGAGNIDWEDISADSSYVYVADIGNNFGSRDTLCIYRVSLDELLLRPEQIKTCGKITFSFPGEGTSNEKGLYSRDGEALLSHGDSLYLFSKDWVGERTTIYALPAKPGHHIPDSLRTYEAGMLVTGADFYAGRDELCLVGYHRYMPVVITYAIGRRPDELLCGGKARIYPLRLGRQVEGVCYDEKGRIYISAEKAIWKQALFRLEGSNVLPY